ncbi:hypothetical protein, conserved [Leishmania donovani]|uniref:Uncharacterized protein n=1 Tax=Leishmania donovani TaxID=5661 RepID=E9BA74_LEIDO|nr:hypothetical protein, conserved [Leishmania donovani]TPP46648.1 hypothetical protein CGC21_23775 [Leishmania donovani]CBZ32147.1 hypothetical protein, conserved [Leishmania donovani]
MTSLTGVTGPAAAVAPFSEENAIVLDKWLYDVCGVDGLQFPSHRRAQFARYVERLPLVAKTKRFVANTFNYPSRSGTREVLVLQKMLEALALHTQAVARETEQVQNNVLQVRRVLEERTMGASAIVDGEKADAVSGAAAAVERRKGKGAAAASSAAQAPSYASSPQGQGYVPLDSAAAAGDNGAATPARSAEATPKPQQAGDEAVSEDGDASATQQPFSAAARAARRADYDKKKALSLRYISAIQTKTQDMSRQRVEMEQRHARLLADKEQLGKEYEALQTTEELVVARHQEAESRKNEETLLLSEEAAMYAAEEAAFDMAWAECAAMLNEQPAAACSTGEPAGRAEGPPSTSPRPHVPSLSPPSYLGSASSHPLPAPSSSSRSLSSEDPVDVAAAAPPNTVPATVAAANQEDSAGKHPGTLSGRNPSGGSSSTAQPPLHQQTLEALRHRLSEIGARTTNYRRQLLNEGHMHLQRFLQSQQRLKDWQGMAAQLRRTHHQLRGQVDVIHTVLSDTARRLEKSDATAQRAGYGEQLTRLNALLKERSYETLQYYVGSREDAEMDMLLDASADEELRKLQRPSPASTLAGGDLTPARAGSASASSLTTPTRQSAAASPSHSSDRALPPSGSWRTPVRQPASNGTVAAATPSSGTDIRSSVDSAHRHRSRYELVRHLQRWEAVLLAERLAILKAAHMVPGPNSGTGANTKQADGFSARNAYEELRALLLQQRDRVASSSS